MSRVSEALKRAAEQAKGAQEPPAHALGKEADTPFVSPWDFAPMRAEPVLGGERHSESEGESGELTPDLVDQGRAASTAGVDSPVSSVRLDSQLAMGWPQPFAADVSAKLVVMRDTDTVAVGQYRKLRAALFEVQKERGVKSVMVTSAVAGEGKTLTAVNLALTLSEAGRGRVLLIDADLRRPRVHELFQVSLGAGLAGRLMTAERWMPVVRLTRSLALLPAGRPVADPGEVLGSDRMRAVLADASASFDWVILDTPPAVLLPDAGLVAPLVEAVVLVVEAGKTPCEQVESTVETLGRDRLLGVVLNRTPERVAATTIGT
jgi:capsular exopolysaccharide synthesis family protein